MKPRLPAAPVPDFRSRGFLRQHIADIMEFYDARCIDPVGGFFHGYRNDGSIFDSRTRHLLSSAKFVFNFAMAARHFGSPRYAGAARHGLAYLHEIHRDSATGGYVWIVRDGCAADRTNHGLGVAHVLLAYASAHKAGSDQAASWMEQTWNLLEERYWDRQAGLYRDQADADWHFSAYRGQHTNLRLCEALLGAYEADGNPRYLDRALLIAQNITQRQAQLANGLVWEHYDDQWRIDWNHHRDEPKHPFQPWGFVVGHQTGWSRLLLQLDRHCRRPASEVDLPASVPGSIEPLWKPMPARQESSTLPLPYTQGYTILDPHAVQEALPPMARPESQWLLPTARRLFDTAVPLAWDEKHGGLCQSFDPEGNICDDDKHYWTQAETLAASALLAQRTGQDEYWMWYERIWQYAWQHMVDHQYGAWYRVLDRRNQHYDDRKSPPGKADLRVMNACYEVLQILDEL